LTALITGRTSFNHLRRRFWVLLSLPSCGQLRLDGSYLQRPCPNLITVLMIIPLS
jgi:hypothetical protein